MFEADPPDSIQAITPEVNSEDSNIDDAHNSPLEPTGILDQTMYFSLRFELTLRITEAVFGTPEVVMRLATRSN